jgi:hypothetical protein
MTLVKVLLVITIPLVVFFVLAYALTRPLVHQTQQ